MTDAPNTNPSPKARFIAIKSCVDAHRELISRPDFNLALEYAQAQMVWEKSALSANGNDAAANFYKVQGVHDFIGILKKLAEQQKPLPQPDAGGISHEFK